MLTWHCFEAFTDQAIGTEWSEALLLQARQERPDIFREGMQPANFTVFAQA